LRAYFGVFCHPAFVAGKIAKHALGASNLIVYFILFCFSMRLLHPSTPKNGAPSSTTDAPAPTSGAPKSGESGESGVRRVRNDKEGNELKKIPG
jgi:hypothetical protein